MDYDLFFNPLNDDAPLDSLIGEDRPSMIPAFDNLQNDLPFLLDDGIIPDSDEAFFAPPPPRKRRFMDHKTSIFTIIRDSPVKEPTPNHNKFLEKRRRAVALRLNAQGSGDSVKSVEQPQAPAPRVYKKIEQKMRNRISAQLSRDRKKGYINVLERQNADLRKENRNLKEELEALQDEISKMREKCALSTADSGSGPKLNNGQSNSNQSNGGGSNQSSNNGSQNNSHTMSDSGNQSEQNSEAIVQDPEENYQRYAMSGNSMFLSLFSVLSVCAIIAMTNGPNGMHADGLHAQAERLRVLAAMQPRCAGYKEESVEAQAMFEKIHRLKRELNASKIQNQKCAQPQEVKQCGGSMLNSTNTKSLNSTHTQTSSKSMGKSHSKKNLRSSTAVMEYNYSQVNSTTNNTNSTGTLFCPSGVIVSSVLNQNMLKGAEIKEAPSLVSMGSYEALEKTFGKESLLQIILPTTNLTVLKQGLNGKSEITHFGNKEDKLIEMICVVKGMNEVS